MRSSGKAYLVGEFDWTVRYTRLGLLLGLIPFLIVSRSQDLQENASKELTGRHCLLSAKKVVQSTNSPPLLQAAKTQRPDNYTSRNPFKPNGLARLQIESIFR
jgi:hypothetical protein